MVVEPWRRSWCCVNWSRKRQLRSWVSAESAEECNMVDMQLFVGMNEMNERIRVAEAGVTEAE